MKTAPATQALMQRSLTVRSVRGFRDGIPQFAAIRDDYESTSTGVLRRSADEALMKTRWTLVLLGFSVVSIFFCSPARGLSGGMETAVVQAMRKLPCNEAQRSAGHKGILSGLIGSGGPANECIAYELHSEKVTYIIRPRVAILLLLGANVEIKLVNDELLLRTDQAPKEIRCAVLSMTLRSEEQQRKQEREEQRHIPICLSDSGDAVPCGEETEAFR
jgi:hypothetical protein